MKTPHQNLNDYFERARRERPLLERDDVRRLIATGGASRGNTIHRKSPRIQLMIIIAAFMAILPFIIPFGKDGDAIRTPLPVRRAPAEERGPTPAIAAVPPEKNAPSESKISPEAGAGSHGVSRRGTLPVGARNGKSSKSPELSAAPSTIDGIRLAPLSPAEAAKLGIHVGSGEVECYDHFGSGDLDLTNDTVRTMLKMMGQDSSNVSFTLKMIATPNGVKGGMADIDDAELPPFSPLILTNRHPNGGGYSFLFCPKLDKAGMLDQLEAAANGAIDDKRYDSLLDLFRTGGYNALNKLVPVSVRAGEDAGPKGWEVIFWYYPTPEFIAALPERIRTRIGEEIAAVDRNASAKEERSGEHYLDLWRGSSGAIGGSYIYPIPATGPDATLRYRLNQPRSIAVTLYNVFGGKLRQLRPMEHRDAGAHEEKLDLSDLESGVYLVSIRSDRGEEAVQRLMVH